MSAPLFVTSKEPITVAPKDRLEEVIFLMKKTGHTGYPVVKGEELVGIITEHDIGRALDKLDVKEWIVSEVCSKEVISVVQSCPVSLVFLKMAKHNVNRMPVIESKNSPNQSTNGHAKSITNNAARIIERIIHRPIETREPKAHPNKMPPGAAQPIPHIINQK